MAERNRPHIVVGADHTASESFTSTRSGPSGSESPPSPPDRGAHRDKLTREMAAAIALAETIRSELPDDTPRPDGVYLTFESYGLERPSCQLLTPLPSNTSTVWWRRKPVILAGVGVVLTLMALSSGNSSPDKNGTVRADHPAATAQVATTTALPATSEITLAYTEPAPTSTTAPFENRPRCRRPPV